MPSNTAVSGRFEWSIAEFQHRCLVAIEREQDKPLPDNAIIAVLCNSVRLAREWVEQFDATPSTSVDAVDALQDLFNMVLYALESRDALLISKTCATMKKAEDALAAARGEQGDQNSGEIKSNPEHLSG